MMTGNKSQLPPERNNSASVSFIVLCLFADRVSTAKVKNLSRTQTKTWNDRSLTLLTVHTVSTLHRYTALMLRLFIASTTRSDSYRTKWSAGVLLVGGARCG